MNATATEHDSEVVLKKGSQRLLYTHGGCAIEADLDVQFQMEEGDWRVVISVTDVTFKLDPVRKRKEP